jgi:hypothetical protein
MMKQRTTFVPGSGFVSQQPLDDGDDLFALTTHTCVDCGASFSTSRRATRCALCASLASGAVGPATVVCPGCDVTHQIAVLAPHKFCRDCAADLPATLDRLLAEADALSARLDADVAHADEATQARFSAAVQMLHTGELGGRGLSLEQVRAAWAKARAKGDDLSALLALYDAAQAAAARYVGAREGI